MAEVIGEAFLSAFFQVVLEKLASSGIIDHIRRNKIEDELVNKLDSINQVLDEAEKKQYQSRSVKEWLHDVKHAIYEADQLLDEIATDAPKSKKEDDSQPATSMVRSLFSSFTNPFESRIKDLLKDLEILAKKKEMLELKEATCASNKGEVSMKLLKRLPTTSLVNQSTICGRDDDKEEITQFLLSDNVSGNEVPVISIVGMGGMGKTTLAQLVYNDQRMLEQFDLKVWVYVSPNFDVVGLTKAILRSFGSSAQAEDLNLLQLELQQRLLGKKFFLVLDDVWNEDYASWELLQLPFNYGSSGSKILITTRDKKVALVMKSIQQLHLKQLEEKDSWSLFVRHAFHDKNVSEYPHLESIGRKIVDKCGGLPLAIKTLGNLLRTKFSAREWVKVLETDMWRLSEDSDINPALRLSYHILPSNLKRCFAYCSIFPKAYVFNKDQLIKLWMAEGLLNCCGTDRSEEELGNEFFTDLELMSFFQQSEEDDGCFIMHDLVNDLAKSVSGEFCLRIEEGDKLQDISKRTRYIWCSPELKVSDKILEHICKCDGLRSLIVSTKSNNVQHFIFSRLKYLRVLSFRHDLLSELSDEIRNLKLLRYLDLSYTDIKRLPDSICMLHNLLTLKLTCCRNLTELPSDFYKLVNLHHLYLEGTLIEKMPKYIGRLKQIQMLTHFVVGDHSGSDIKELDQLNHLQGRLDILGLENVIHPTDAAKANLKGKKHLEELQLEYGASFMRSRSTSREMDDSIIERHVLEVLQPNSNLNRLAIINYHGATFPDWLGGVHLPNLVSINLNRCKFCSCLPPLGELPSLKELSVLGCHKIEIIGPEFYGNNSSNAPFRSLESLHFQSMLEWKEWFCFEGGQSFPFLKELSIRYCPKLKKSLPQHLPSLQKMAISGCRELEASIPKADYTCELRLEGCDNILLHELPSNLKNVFISGTHAIESSLKNILFNSTFLEVLNVRDFYGLNLKCSSFDLRSCSSLRTFDIRDWYPSIWPSTLHLFTNLHSLVLFSCPQLESFPEGGLPLSLSNLEIRRCPKLIASRQHWDLFKLHALKEFTVSDDFRNVESFPEESLLPPNINVLCLEICSKLRIVNYKGLSHLKSLKVLSIRYCPCLECLPEEGLLNSLSALSIHDCALLTPRYQKDEGEHWHKIRHIPSVSIW